MDAGERKLLQKAARLIIDEAQAVESDQIFSATGFANENISIMHQQMRCVNLAWALRQTKRVKRGDVVAIVGGSFSGLMLSATLAIADDVIVYLFEKEKRLLHRFLDKGHRYLSPNLNSRYLGTNFDPEGSRSFFEPPIFKWRSGSASDVAAQWLEEFKRYEQKLPIFTFLDREVTRQHIKPRDGGLVIDLRTREDPRIQPIAVDLIIDATGFGEEVNPHRLVDFSYWESGHRLIYDHLPKTCNVLVSGCGDSGLIEALHYAIKGFSHGMVEDLWPQGVNLEAQLDLGLEAAKLDDIQRSEEIERYDGRVISEICWWLDSWFRLEHWKSNGWSLRRQGRHTLPVFRAIEEVLKPSLDAAFPGRTRHRLSWDDREAFALRLPLNVQLEAREAVLAIANPWISRAMQKLVHSFPLSKLLRTRRLHAMARPGVTVTLNGRMPTPYSRELSTYNVWLMRVLLSFPNVRYRQGVISEVKPKDTNGFSVTFDRGPMQVFDRVVTRYGAAAAMSTPISTRRSRDPHTGCWLLTPVHYRRPGEKPDTLTIVEPAVHRITSKLDALERCRGSRRSESLIKILYVGHLLCGATPSSSGIYLDPQAWLSTQLRSGIRPRFVDLRAPVSRRPTGK